MAITSRSQYANPSLQLLPLNTGRALSPDTARRSIMMKTTTMTLKGRICSLLIILTQCVMFVDAQFGRKKRQEREGGPAAVPAAIAVEEEEEGVTMEKLVTHGHEQNGTSFYIFTGLFAFVASVIMFYSMTHFSFSVSSRKQSEKVLENEPSLGKTAAVTDTVVVCEEKCEKGESECAVTVTAENAMTATEENAMTAIEENEVTAIGESAATVSGENAAAARKENGSKEKAVPAVDEANAERHTEDDIATADIPSEKAAPIPSIISDTIETYFPGALTGPSLAKTIESALARNGYDKDKTLLATSLCCDEVNRMLEKDIASVYGDHFSMGGLAGFAFGGITSFGAMAHHIPDGGSCVIMYGPHVGVDSEGKVGTVNRRGRAKGGACCGSAKAAAGYVKNKSSEEIVEVEAPTKALDAFTQRYLELKTSGTGRTGRATSIAAGCVKKVGPKERKELEAQTEALDAQQTFVGNMLLPFSKRLEEAEDPDVELPFSLFDAQDEFMKAIVAKGCGNVAGEGKIALLGGIQINTPGDCPEFFLPLVFEIRNNKGELVADLIRLLESS